MVPGLSVPEGLRTVAPTSCTVVEVIDVCGSHAGLQREQIGIAAAIERHRGHLPAGDHLAQLRARGLDVQRVVADAHCLRDAADLERSIERERRIGIEHDIIALIAGKARRLHLQFVMANRQNREGVMALAVAVRLVERARCWFREQSRSALGTTRPRRVLDRAGDTPAHAGPGRGSREQGNDQQSMLGLAASGLTSFS